MDFETWMKNFMQTPEWEDDSFHWDHMAATAYKAGADSVSVKVDRLEEHLANGCKIELQDGLWHLFSGDGEGIARGKTVREMLVDLVLSNSTEEICESCQEPLGDDAPLCEDANICRKCHDEINETENIFE